MKPLCSRPHGRIGPLASRFVAPLALLAWLAGPLLPLAPARAELPPWVYAQDQRQAPLRLELEVLDVQQWPVLQPKQLLVQVRVLQVLRQPRGGRLASGDRLTLRYALPPPRPEGWVGPAPLPIVRVGERLPAWLAADPHQTGVVIPAAGGRSFGPSLESAQEPPAGP